MKGLSCFRVAPFSLKGREGDRVPHPTMSSMGELPGAVLSKGWTPFYWLSVLSKNVVSFLEREKGITPAPFCRMVKVLEPVRVEVVSIAQAQVVAADMDDKELVGGR